MPCTCRLFFMAANFAALEAAMAESVKFVRPATPTAKTRLLPISRRGFFLRAVLYGLFFTSCSLRARYYQLGFNRAPKDPLQHRHERVATVQR